MTRKAARKRRQQAARLALQPSPVRPASPWITIGTLVASTALSGLNPTSATALDLSPDSVDVRIDRVESALRAAARERPNRTNQASPARRFDIPAGPLSDVIPEFERVTRMHVTLHHVRPVTAGVRIVSFFWIQSLIRDDGERTLLFDLDRSIQRVNVDVPDHPVAVQLTGIYHNLVRRWADL